MSNSSQLSRWSSIYTFSSGDAGITYAGLAPALLPLSPSSLSSHILRLPSPSDRTREIGDAAPYIKSVVLANGTKKNQLMGAMMVDVRLLDFGGYLTQQLSLTNGVFFVVERTWLPNPHQPNVTVESGRLVMYSNSDRDNSSSGGVVADRIVALNDARLAIEAENDLIQSTSKYILRTFGSWEVPSTADRPSQFSCVAAQTLRD